MGRRSRADGPFKLTLGFGGPDKQWEMAAFHEVFGVLFGQRKPDSGPRGKDQMCAAKAIARLVNRDVRDQAKRAKARARAEAKAK